MELSNVMIKVLILLHDLVFMLVQGFFNIQLCDLFPLLNGKSFKAEL
jgi:hypothetical protein